MTIEKGKKKGSFIMWFGEKPKRIQAPREKFIFWKGERIELKKRIKTEGSLMGRRG